jgi:hypothetical protein
MVSISKLRYAVLGALTSVANLLLAKKILQSLAARKISSQGKDVDKIGYYQASKRSRQGGNLAEA